MSNTNINYNNIEVGDDIPSISRSIDTVQVLNFVDVWTGDPKPTRFNDPDTATKEGLAGPIVPGLMTMAFISRLLTEWARGAELKTLDVFSLNDDGLKTQGRVNGDLNLSLKKGALSCDGGLIFSSLNLRGMGLKDSLSSKEASLTCKDGYIRMPLSKWKYGSLLTTFTGGFSTRRLSSKLKHISYK